MTGREVSSPNSWAGSAGIDLLFTSTRNGKFSNL